MSREAADGRIPAQRLAVDRAGRPQRELNGQDCDLCWNSIAGAEMGCDRTAIFNVSSS